MLAAALMAFAAASSEIVVIIYIPLLVVRVIALPRWREHAVTIGFLLGLLTQALAILPTFAQHARLAGMASCSPRSSSTSTPSSCPPSAGTCRGGCSGRLA